MLCFLSFKHFGCNLHKLHFSFPVLVSSNGNVYESVKKCSAFQRERKPSDGTDDLQLSSIISSG